MESKLALLDIPEANLLLEIINQSPQFNLHNVDFDKFIGLVRIHDIIPFVFHGLQDSRRQIPEKTYVSLKSAYLSNVLRNLRFWKEFLQINDAFRKNNIAMLPLKGMDILARFYPNFDFRSIGDIDIVVKEEQFTQAEKILSDLHYTKRLDGFKESYWRNKQCDVSFSKVGIIVDAHWGLDFKRGHRAILPQLWERTRQLELGHQKIDIFSPEDALFSFALHLRRFGNILKLKQVLDVARIIKDSPELDWDYVLSQGSQGRMKATLYFILMQVQLFTKTKIPSEVFRKLGIPSWQKMRIRNFLLKRTFQIEPVLKKDFLRAHFLLYDNICEPALYIINIPYEQFCRFYSLTPYTEKTDLIYHLRFLYIARSLFKKKDDFS